MESSKLSLAVWFKAMFLMTHVKKSYSILELSRILGINRYRTVWYLSMKLRVGMGQDLLGKEYFQFLYLISKAKAQTSQLKAIQNYSISAILKSKIYKRDEINLIAPVDVLKKVEVEEFNLKRKGYRCLKVFGVQRKIELKEVHYAVKPDVQLWLSTLVANSNRMLNGIHHGVSFLHLQKYMFEYSFNYNLRSQDKFEKLKNCVLF
ncbi:transposase [Lishizhenia tianjinensis]|nr:transposase [Lishizhenia tianjinensis]